MTATLSNGLGVAADGAYLINKYPLCDEAAAALLFISLTNDPWSDVAMVVDDVDLVMNDGKVSLAQFHMIGMIFAGHSHIPHRKRLVHFQISNRSNRTIYCCYLSIDHPYKIDSSTTHQSLCSIFNFVPF